MRWFGRFNSWDHRPPFWLMYGYRCWCNCYFQVLYKSCTDIHMRIYPAQFWHTDRSTAKSGFASAVPTRY